MPIRVILLGRKPVACDALRHLRACQVEVVAVVTPGKHEPDPYPERLVDVAESMGIPVVSDRFLEDCVTGAAHEGSLDLRAIDLVISILHQKRIRRSLIELGRIGCINFHPAPLPEYRGWGTYNLAILEDVRQWGVSAHFVDDGFDTGPLIGVWRLPVDTSRETALSLQRKTQPVLLEAFKDVLKGVLRDDRLVGTPQGPGRSFTRKGVMARRFIIPEDSPVMIERKIRAFWYPPNSCAEVQLGGKSYPIINHPIFTELVPLVCSRPAE
jgi:methionyl-tRNA formyltransferase